jgi:hypothetical protein
LARRLKPGLAKEIDMKRLFKLTILSAALAATTLAAIPGAEAGDRWRHRHNDNGDLVAAGVLGLAVGALAAGAATASPRYYEPAPRYYEPDYVYVEPRYNYRRVRPARVYVDDYAGSLEPWTPELYRYCENRYRSFNPRSGTFTGYDGVQHFCAAN